MDKTKIDWCDSTWNPVTGCLHGCEYCYARKIAERFGGKQKYANIFEENEPIIGADSKALAYPHSFSPTFHRYRLNDYIGKKGRNIFVCSMADLFGNWVPDSWIEEVFAACEKAPQHNYLFLTKNPGRYVELINNTNFFVKTKGNMWFGYSYTGKGCKQWWNPDYNIFASVEPILEPIEVPRCKWLIVGAETGRRKDRVIPKREWIEHLVYYCGKWNISLFMKSSLAEIWGEPLIQEFPKELRRCSE
ncbi:MAG: DUF5131 family protein [Lachnospiraceae bacterium]|nr:DUF5131 family protein [Lachnospiraceae bacterium]